MSAMRLGIVSALVLVIVACPQPRMTPTTLPPITLTSLVLGDSTFVALVGSSSAAFFGTVVSRPGRTTDAVPLTPLTAVVRVDSLITWGSAVDIAPGDSVTVVLRNTAHPTLNTRYAFLANGIVVDTGVVVEETYREEAPAIAVATTFPNAYGTAVTRALDRQTHDHLPEIAVVAWGVVTTDSAPVMPDSITRLNRSETAPAWRVATLAPRRVLRGDTTLAHRPMRVLFPGSRHIIYARVPRPKVGDLAMYLLHRPAQFAHLSFAGIDTTGAFVLFDRLDVRPLGDTTRVVGLFSSRP